MSGLAVLASVATLVSTVQMLPHLINAFRHRRPGGSPMGWTLSATGSILWVAYGVAVNDWFVAAPGLFTVPAGIALAVWSWVASRSCAQPDLAVALAHRIPEQRRSDDTMELPVLARV